MFILLGYLVAFLFCLPINVASYTVDDRGYTHCSQETIFNNHCNTFMQKQCEYFWSLNGIECKVLYQPTETPTCRAGTCKDGIRVITSSGAAEINKLQNTCEKISLEAAEACKVFIAIGGGYCYKENNFRSCRYLGYRPG